MNGPYADLIPKAAVQEPPKAPPVAEPSCCMGQEAADYAAAQQQWAELPYNSPHRTETAAVCKINGLQQAPVHGCGSLCSRYSPSVTAPIKLCLQVYSCAPVGLGRPVPLGATRTCQHSNMPQTITRQAQWCGQPSISTAHPCAPIG